MSDYPAISAILLEIRLAADLIGSMARWAYRAVGAAVRPFRWGRVPGRGVGVLAAVGSCG